MLNKKNLIVITTELDTMDIIAAVYQNQLNNTEQQIRIKEQKGF